MPLPEFTSHNLDQTTVFHRCVEDCNEPIMISDRTGKLIYVNPAWSEIYGYSREEALGQTPRLLRSHHQPPAFYEQMWADILNPKIGRWKGRLINKSKDGREIPVLLSINPYKNPQGETLGYMGIALDLSAREALEEQVQHQEKLVTIGELTSGIAHEIGTPIGVIRGRAEMLMMELGEHPSVKKTLDIIIKQSDRISTLINTLLRFSRSGGSHQLKPISLASVTLEVFDLLQEKLKKHNVEVQNQLPHELEVLGDKDKLEQVFLNLILNSLHAMEQRPPPPHGRHFIQIGFKRDEKSVAIRVADSGGGIPAPIRARIFTPFFTTKPAGKGTGLGLSIVSRLMHEMEGEISLVSAEPPGAVFLLTFRASSRA